MAACKDCQNRHEGCHSNCEKYREFLKEVQKKKDNRKEYEELQRYLHTHKSSTEIQYALRNKGRIFR